MRETGVDYLVGTPRKLLDSFEATLLDTPWQQAREDVVVKSLQFEGDTYVLAKSKSRLHKERAIRHRKLRQYLKGLTSQAVLEVFSTIQMLDVHIPTQDHRMLHLQRYTEPEQEHKILLEKLNLRLPAQPPPKIYSHNTTTGQTPL